MPRKGHVIRRDVLADPIYNSKLITKCINFVMLDGKKGVAQSIVYGALKQVEEKTGNSAVEVFNTAMNNIMPVVEVRSRRVGGQNYQVPTEVRPERRETLGLRWLAILFASSIIWPLGSTVFNFPATFSSGTSFVEPFTIATI